MKLAYMLWLTCSVRDVHAASGQTGTTESTDGRNQWQIQNCF